MKSLIIIFNGINAADINAIRKFNPNEAEILNLSDDIKSNYGLNYYNKDEMLLKYQNIMIENMVRWIGEAGDKVIHNGRNIKQIMAINNEISLWWFNAMQYKYHNEYEMCDWLVYAEMIKDLLLSHSHDRYYIFGGKNRFLMMLKAFIPDGRLSYSKSINEKNVNEIKLLVKGILKTLAYSLCMICFGALIKIPYKKSSKPRICPDISFFSIYQASLVRMKGKICERYYGAIPECLQSSGKRINFFSVFGGLKDMGMIFKSSERKLLEGFPYEIVFLESLLNARDVLRRLIDFIKSSIRIYLLPKETKQALFIMDGRDYSIIFKELFLKSAYDQHNLQMLLMCDAAYKYMRQYKPRVIMDCFVVNHSARSMVYGVRKCKSRIRIFGIQHASRPRAKIECRLHINEIDPEIGKNSARYVPFPDYFICQGKLTRDLLIKSGMSADRCLMAGSPRFDSLFKYSSMLLASKIPRLEIANDIPSGSRVLLVATSAMPFDVMQLMDVLFGAIDGRHYLIFKPHPNMQNIGSIIEKYGPNNKGIKYMISNDNIHDLILISDILITTQSTVAEEAIAIGRPAISIHAGARINMSALPSIGINSVRNSDQLKERIEESLSRGCDLLNKYRMNVIEQCFGYFDGEATRRVVEIAINSIKNEMGAAIK